MQTKHAVHVYGHSVNTDVIFAGKYTYSVRDTAQIAAHALEDLDPDFVKRVREGDVIVAGRNWGIGSSREQAVTCLKYNGIKAIIAESFSGLYFRNCINQGVRPIVCAGVWAMLKTGDTIVLDHAENALIVGAQRFALPRLSPSVQAILDSGGIIPMLKARFA
jgi:3-isopropylmalate/(R)-2-methylmalate dehydratase small subunit